MIIIYYNFMIQKTSTYEAHYYFSNFNYRNTKYATCLRWFKAGNLDITFMTLYDFISIQPTKLPSAIIGVTDYSNGGDKIIVRNSIKKAADLRRKKILLPTDTISLWLLGPISTRTSAPPRRQLSLPS